MIIKVIKTLFLIFVCCQFSVHSFSLLGAEENVITVYSDREIGLVNKKIMGSSFLGYEPSAFNLGWKTDYSNSDFGAGVWDPARKQPVKEVLALARDAAISAVRFTTNNYYNWKDAVGYGRKHFLYGIDEFMTTAELTGAEPIFTIGYFTASPADAADLVEYLNAPADKEHHWATVRASNGRAAPYQARYFEIGNEVWDGNNRDIKRVSPEEYGLRYLDYYNAMKKVDPSIQIGVVLDRREEMGWDRRVLDIVKDKVDFGIIHMYPTPVWGQLLERIDPLEIFGVSLAIPSVREQGAIENLLGLLKQRTGKSVPIAITEFNAGFVQDKPVPYRHSLGAALINAELLRLFMKPEYNILMSNNHHFSNAYFGMVRAKDDYQKHNYKKPIQYIKRPTYYVYEMYARHFGDVLIDNNVVSGSYELNDDKTYMKHIITSNIKGKKLSENLLRDEWNIKPLPGVKAEDKDGVLMVEFVDPEEFNYYHVTKKVEIEPDTYYFLSGYIKTEGLEDRNGVGLEIQDNKWLRIRSAENTERFRGTTDWTKINLLFKTLPDADSLLVIVRRIGKEGPVKGRVYVRDVRLQKFDPDLRVPYLSVNTSKSSDGKTIYMMVINRNMQDSVKSLIDIRGAIPTGGVEAWILNGPSAVATNEHKQDNVKIVEEQILFDKFPIEFSFPPHSLTAIEIDM